MEAGGVWDVRCMEVSLVRRVAGGRSVRGFGKGDHKSMVQNKGRERGLEEVSARVFPVLL